MPKLLLTKSFLNHSRWWGTCLQAQECWGYGPKLEPSCCLGIRDPKGLPDHREGSEGSSTNEWWINLFCGNSRLCPINTSGLISSTGRHLHTHSTHSTLPQKPLHNKCLFPHQVSENMQILRKAPAFETPLLCFPSKYFLFISPLSATTSSPTPAAHSKFCPMLSSGVWLPQLLLGGAKATSEAPIPYACIWQKLFMLWLPCPHCSRVLAGTSVNQPQLVDTHTQCTTHQFYVQYPLMSSKTQILSLP